MIRILLRLYALYAVSPGQLALAGFCAVLVAGLGLALPCPGLRALDRATELRGGAGHDGGGAVGREASDLPSVSTRRGREGL